MRRGLVPSAARCIGASMIVPGLLVAADRIGRGALNLTLQERARQMQRVLEEALVKRSLAPPGRGEP
jgi:hypothetical protein